MPGWTRTALIATALVGAAFVAGCEGDYYGDDGYYGRDSYSYRYRDRDDYYRDRDYERGGRHWVCDADGDDCHWSR